MAFLGSELGPDPERYEMSIQIQNIIPDSLKITYRKVEKNNRNLSQYFLYSFLSFLFLQEVGW